MCEMRSNLRIWSEIPINRNASEQNSESKWSKIRRILTTIPTSATRIVTRIGKAEDMMKDPMIGKSDQKENSHEQRECSKYPTFSIQTAYTTHCRKRDK